MAEERRVIELGVGDVDLVGGLWKEMVAHHQEVVGDGLPGRDPDEAWRMRRAEYVEWLGSGEGMLFLVPGEGAEQAPLGYAFLRVGSSGPTWNLGDQVGDLESLSVTAAARGMGIGTELIKHCRERLRALGARWWSVSVVAANERAAELYEREGFRPYVNHLVAPIEWTRSRRPT
jgi:ribosomal protein S18 acetylase RimI-like enzyme